LGGDVIYINIRKKPEMKKLSLIILSAIVFVSCTTPRQINASNSEYGVTAYGLRGIDYEPPLTKSLFEDKSSTISEENIQTILDG